MEGTIEILDTNEKFLKFNSLESAKENGISFVSGDRKKEGILPNLSIYENLVVPLYKKTSKAGFLGFINWMELNGIYDWEVERLNIKTGPSDNLNWLSKWRKPTKSYDSKIICTTSKSSYFK